MGQLAASLHRLGDASDLLPLVTAIAQSAGIDPALVMAVIDAESNFNPTATHRDADGGSSYGLMQLRLETASLLAGYAVQGPDLFVPEFNIRLGVRYLADQLARYGGNVTDAVAAYNAGTARRNAAGIYVNSRGVPNVQAYVDRVMAAYPRYQAMMMERPTSEFPEEEAIPNGDGMGRAAPWLGLAALGVFTIVAVIVVLDA